MRESNSLRGKHTFGPRLAAIAATASFAIIFAATAFAQATSETSFPVHRAHRTAAATASKSSQSKSNKYSAKPASQAHAHSVAQSKPVAAQSKPVPAQSKPVPAQSKSASHSRHHSTHPAYNPPVVSRTHSTPRSRAQQAQEHRAALTSSPGTHSDPHVPGQISAQPPVSVAKTLTTEDFMRAAGESNSPQPQHSTTSLSTAIVTPYTPAPQPQRPERRDTYVAGFGAEGAILNTPRSSASSAAVTASAIPPATNDPELAALSHPSHEELAESALQPRLPNLSYSRNGRLIVPAPLVGSHDVLVHQNEMADAEGLVRIENDYQLAILRDHHQLVDIPESAGLELNPDLPDNRRCARPWSVKFATDMARAYYARFHQALQINSAVRTVQYQMHLERINGNAAGVDGEAASPHLTGQAIDFGKRGMSLTQIAWMRAYLKPLMDSGKLDVEEEFHQACFHISVYRSYLGVRKSTPHTDVAQITSGASTEK
jgi:hypothetical protein